MSLKLIPGPAAFVLPCLCLALSCSTGAYSQERITRPMVIVDPDDRENVRGNAVVGMAWGVSFEPPRNYTRSLITLCDYMNIWTGVYMTPHSNLRIDSPDLLSVPVVFISTGEEFSLTPAERVNLRKYWRSGGFVVCENAMATNRMSPAERSFNRMVEETLGDGAELKPVPHDHRLYHCFYDFGDGPPKVRQSRGMTKGELLGVWIDGRLTGLYSNMGYIGAWDQAGGNILQLKMGVNMVIFALTADGGMTRGDIHRE